MYMDLIEKDPNRNRRNGLIVFVICIILMGCIIKCAAQVKRSHPFGNAKEVTRIATDRSLMFFVNIGDKNDTIFLGIYADSLKKDTYYMSFYVHFPKGLNITASRLDVGFDKQGIESFNSTNIVSGDGYVEYRVSNQQYTKLKSYKYEYINFSINGYDVSFEDNDGDYFSRFFRLL